MFEYLGQGGASHSILISVLFPFLRFAVGKNDEDEDETVHRGLDPYPVDKDNVGGSGASSPGTTKTVEKGNEVFIMNKNEDRTTSFFSQPGILAGKESLSECGLIKFAISQGISLELKRMSNLLSGWLYSELYGEECEEFPRCILC